MSIEELTSFIAPPVDPIDGVGDWAVAEAEFGVGFPSDFKELIRYYGTGSFDASLDIANPLKPWGRKYIQEMLAGHRELREACEYFNLIMHPDRPGLLPWGRDSHGHLYCWWTKGDPDGWGIVQVFHGYEDEIETVPGPMSCFLVRYMSNAYPNMLGGREFTDEQRFFERGIPWVS